MNPVYMARNGGQYGFFICQKVVAKSHGFNTLLPAQGDDQDGQLFRFPAGVHPKWVILKLVSTKAVLSSSGLDTRNVTGSMVTRNRPDTPTLPWSRPVNKESNT